MKKTVLTIGTVAVFTLGSAFTGSSSSVHADTSLEDVNDQQAEVKDKLSGAESEIADVLFEIKELNQDIDRLETAMEENREQSEKNEKKINNLEDEIDELNEKIEKRNDILKDRLSSYQENGGDVNYLEVFLGSKNFSEFVSRLSAVNSITNADADLIEENENDKTTVEEKLDEQEKLSQELEDQEKTIASQKEQKKESKSNLKDKEDQVKKEKEKLESKSSELKSLESDIRESIETPETPQVASETTESSNTASASSSSSNASNSGSKSKGSSQKASAPVGGGSAISAGMNMKDRGTTYSYGAQDPSQGLFDCSGFVQWAYQQEGVSLPRTTSAMASVGTKVPYSEAQSGDLVIFRGGTHVGIYLGGGKFLGSQTSTGVAVADMNSGYWAQHFDNNVRRIQ